eukprot:UN05609
MKSWINEVYTDEKYSIENKFQIPLEHTGAQLKLSKILEDGHHLMSIEPSWIKKLEMEEIWKQLYKFISIVYLAFPGDFFVLHLVTWLFGMEQIVNRLPTEEQQREAIRCYWMSTLGFLFFKEQCPTP